MQGGKGLQRVVIFFTLCCVGLAALFFYSQYAVMEAGEGRLYTDVAAVPPRRVALVLGTRERLPNGRKNLFFTYRIEAAAALYKAGKVEHLIVSGQDEPAAMRDALVEAGVPPEAITLDNAGFRTLDSVIRAARVYGVRDYVIVSQRFHVQRAIFIADHYGADAIGFCARDVPQYAAFKTRLRELGARVKVVLDLYFLDTQPRFVGPPEPIRPASGSAAIPFSEQPEAAQSP